MESTSKCSEILAQLHHSRRERIQRALERSDVADPQDLEGIVRGKSNPDATALLEKWLELPLPDASALAGVLLASSAPGQAAAALPDLATILSDAVLSGMRRSKMDSPPTLRTTETNSRDDEAKHHYFPANFSLPPVEYPSYHLNARQISRVESKKYFTAVKRGIEARHGTNRYIVNASRTQLRIKDGARKVFSCNINDHNIRCAFLELLATDYDVEAFLGNVVTNMKTGQQYVDTESPEYID